MPVTSCGRHMDNNRTAPLSSTHIYSTEMFAMADMINIYLDLKNIMTNCPQRLKRLAP